MLYVKPTKSDAEAISFLFKNSFNNFLISNNFSKHLINVYLENLDFALIAKDGDKIIGFAYAIDDFSKVAKHATFLDKVLPWRLGYFVPAYPKYLRKPFALVYCVAEKYRNKGVASELFSRILNKMKSKSEVIFFQIYLDNNASIKVAEKCGARLIEKKGLLRKFGIFQIDL